MGVVGGVDGGVDGAVVVADDDGGGDDDDDDDDDDALPISRAATSLACIMFTVTLVNAATAHKKAEWL